MKLDRDILIKGSFVVALAVTIIAIFIDFTQFYKLWPLVIIGIIAKLTFIVIAISEVSRCLTIEKSEKIMWIVCIILLGNIAAIIYMFSGRKRICRISA